MSDFVLAPLLELSSRNVHFFVRLRSFHYVSQALTMKARMIRLSITNSITSVCGNAANNSPIPTAIPDTDT
jgi:hypothetical protein